MRPKGTKLQLEVRRRVAVALLHAGWGLRQVARQVGASPSSVSRWRDAFDHQADTGLNAKQHPGSTPKLTAQQRQQLTTFLSQGPHAHGLGTTRWTLAGIAAVIECRFGITYTPSGVWHLLRRLRRGVPDHAEPALVREDVGDEERGLPFIAS